MKHFLYTVFVVALGSVTTLAQLVTNDGAAIFSSAGALIFVDGEMVNQGLGTYDHSGTIELTGDWTNNAGNAAFINGSPGTVNMTGGTQTIKGTDPTLFYDLILTGSGDKAQQVNATVTDSLALNDKELATDTFIMHVTNTSTTAITRTTGFVSSIDTGGLVRDMANIATYLFPVGSSVGVSRYRPVEIDPNVATAHTYKVRMANVDATTEGYDRSINDSTFCVINPDYYHRIYQTNGVSSADITIYYDDALDNAYQTIAHWQNAPRWEDISPVTNTVNVSPTLSFMTKTAWNDFLLPAYALATTSPIVSLSANDTSVCEGDTITLSASAGFSNYEFFNNSISVQNGASNIYIVTGLTTGDTISVTATELGCMAFSSQMIVTVNPLPVIDTSLILITPENCGANDGSITGISASGGTLPLTYEWLNSSSVVVGGDSANVMNIPVDDYVLTVTDSNACAASTDIHSVPGGPAVSLDISGMVLVQPSCGNLNGSITGITASGGSGPLTFDWVDGLSVTVGSSLDLTGVGPDSYTLTVTDSLGCTAATGPHVLTDQAGPVLDTAGFTITMSTCGASDGAITGISVSGGTGTLTFDWQNSTPTSVGSTIDLNLVPADSYTLTVTDSNGCTDASGPHVVNDLGAPTIDISSLQIDSSRCDMPTGAITFLTVSGGTTPLTFEWDDPSLQSTENATGLDCDTFSFQVTDASGCVANSGPHVVPCFSAPAAPTAPSPSAYCQGDVIADLTATVNIGTIIWYSDIPLLDSIGTGSPFASGAASDTSYWVAGTNNGCVGPSTQVDIVVNATPSAPFAGNDTSFCHIPGLVDTLIATGGTGIEWWDDNTLTTLLGTGDSLPIAPAFGPNVYFVTQTIGGCQSPYDSVIVTVDVPVSLTIAGDTTICEGDSTVLTASGGISYLWNTTDTTPSITVYPPTGQTVYYVTATAGACTASDTVTVTVNSLPVASITGLNTLCAGETVTLTAGIEQSYSWNTSPVSTSQIITVTPPAGTVTTYTLIVTNGCGSDSISHMVSVEEVIYAGPDIDLCKNTDPIGYGATSSASPAGGTWSSPDTLVFPDNMQPDGFIDHVSIPWGSGYEIVYTSASGNCSDTLLLEVTGADAGLDTSSCTGTSTFFLPEALPPGGTWSSPDADADMNIIDPLTGEVSSDGLAGDYVFVYETLGASGNGCPDSVTINVCGANDIWVPNIFSPNGDDENDIMFVRGIAVDWVLIKIFDRWGELIFDSSQDGDAMLQGWDGTYKGKELTPQVFVYYMEGAFLDGEEFDEQDRQGNITLVK